MDGITTLYNYIMSYLTAILCVVTTALVFIIVTHLHGSRHLKQFKKEENLEDLLNWLRYVQRWTHSTTLELVWTVIPTIILIAIAIPSFILLYSLDEIVDTQSVVKVIGFQWYWKYEYPVLHELQEEVTTFSYLSYMLPFDDLTEDKNRRLLEVDSPLVLPTNVNSKLVITAKDVLHSFAVPALGLKMDAVPGRLNQITVHIFKSGMFYGQCSELCGVNHGFMPIVVAAVDLPTFEQFLSKCSKLPDTLPSTSENTSNSECVSCKIIEPECIPCKIIESECIPCKINTECVPCSTYGACGENMSELIRYTESLCTSEACHVPTPKIAEHVLAPIRTGLGFYPIDIPYLEGEEKDKLIEELKEFNSNRAKILHDTWEVLAEIYYNPFIEEQETFLKPYRLNNLQYYIQHTLIYDFLFERYQKGEGLLAPESFYVYVTNHLLDENHPDYIKLITFTKQDYITKLLEAAQLPESPFYKYKEEIKLENELIANLSSSTEDN